jgi:hypothetical protein
MTLQPPAVGEHLKVSFPAPKVLLLTLNRPERLNAMNDAVMSLQARQSPPHPHLLKCAMDNSFKMI